MLQWWSYTSSSPVFARGSNALMKQHLWPTPCCRPDPVLELGDPGSLSISRRRYVHQSASGLDQRLTEAARMRRRCDFCSPTITWFKSHTRRGGICIRGCRKAQPKDQLSTSFATALTKSQGIHAATAAAWKYRLPSQAHSAIRYGTAAVHSRCGHGAKSARRARLPPRPATSWCQRQPMGSTAASR